MKKLLLIASLFLVSAYAHSQAYWLSQASGFIPVSSGIRNVSIVDSNIVWICAYDGSGGAANRQDFSRTIDGGNLWVSGTVPAPVAYDWSMIFGLNADTGWAMLYNTLTTGGGGLWKTTDGGLNWVQEGATTMFNTSTSFPDIVHFFDADTGFVIGDPVPRGFEILTTYDGGNTWDTVPSANIPLPNAGEYAIVDHYCVIGNTIWFDTNKGRVYRSTDRGHNWTVASTGITVPANSATDLVFMDQARGMIRLANTTGTANTAIKFTADSGFTWTTTAITGKLFCSDLKYIPGTVSKLVSSGAATGFIGTSFSNDGGLSWTTFDSTEQHTALGVLDSTHMWVGGFTTSPTADGIFKFTVIVPVACTDTTVTPGTDVASKDSVCAGDTLFVTSTGVHSPTTGPYAGVGWILSTTDISGTNDPINQAGFLTSYVFNFPAPSTSSRFFVNDGTIIDGINNAYGMYYWTPVVFGNAIALSGTPTYVQDLILDATCTHAGTSLGVLILAPFDPNCHTVGVHEIQPSELSVTTFMRDANTVDAVIHALSGGKATINIFDLTGRMVYQRASNVSGGVNHELIDVANLSSGTYIIRVESNGIKAVNKLVKL